MATITTTSPLHTNPARPRSLTCPVCTPRPPGYEYCRCDRCIKCPRSNAVPSLHLFRSLHCLLHPSFLSSSLFCITSFTPSFQPHSFTFFSLPFPLNPFLFPSPWSNFPPFPLSLFFTSSLHPFLYPSLHHFLYIIFFSIHPFIPFSNSSFQSLSLALLFTSSFTLSIHPFLYSLPSSPFYPST